MAKFLKKLNLFVFGLSIWCQNLLANGENCSILVKDICEPGIIYDFSGSTRNNSMKDLEANLRSEWEKQIWGPINAKLADTLAANENLELKVKTYIEKLVGEVCKSRDMCSKRIANEFSLFLSNFDQARYRHKELRIFTDLFKIPQVRSILNEYWQPIMSKYNKIDKLQNDLNSIGSTVKKIMIDVVNDKHINESIRNKIVEKIGKIHFKAVDCGPSNSRPEFAVSNWTEIYAYYEQYLEEVHICNGYYLFQNSVPSLLFTMSHELAHSFDPNQSAIQIKKKRSFSTSAYNYILTNGYINYSSGAMTDSHIAASEYFLPEVISCLMNHEGLNNDAIFSEKRSSIYSEIKMPFLKSHLPEAFSDLIASEVLGRYINELHPGLTPKEGRFAIINALRFACEVDHLSSRLDATHPSLQNRLEKVVLSNPRIRKLLECTKENINPPNCWDRKYIPYLK